MTILAINAGSASLKFAVMVRAMICEDLAWCGLSLDPDRNGNVIDAEGRITSDNSRLHAHVILSEEELMIAHEAVRCVGEPIMAPRLSV